MVKQQVRKIGDRLGNAALSPPRSMMGRYLNHGDRTRRRVALTFDDGPSRPSTDHVLQALSDTGVPGTFFILGSMARLYPEVVRTAHGQGHVIACHSMDHKRSNSLLPWGGAHLDEVADTLTDIVGERPTLYRPPWGWLTPWESQRLAKRHMHAIGWDVYPDDWMMPEVPASTLVEQVTSRVQPGSIVLFHDALAHVRECTKSQTADALRTLIPRLQADGFEFVSVPELLGISAYTTAA
jgi:peptidoglycan/xylan/chitin deacetylase (PgdA/CDA1 family)